MVARVAPLTDRCWEAQGLGLQTPGSGGRAASYTGCPLAWGQWAGSFPNLGVAFSVCKAKGFGPDTSIGCSLCPVPALQAVKGGCVPHFLLHFPIIASLRLMTGKLRAFSPNGSECH